MKKSFLEFGRVCVCAVGALAVLFATAQPSFADETAQTLDLLSLSDNGGGSITGSPGDFDCAFLPNNSYGTGTCTGERPAGSTVTLTATADSLSSFRGWWAPFACPPPPPGAPPIYLPCFLSSEPTITVTMDDHKIVAAQFQRKTLDVLSLSDNGGGTIAGSPGGFDCVFGPNAVYGTGTCTGQRPTDSTVTLTATPDSLSSFRGWYAPFACPPPPPGAPPNSLPCFLSLEPTITVTMDANKVVAAKFQRRTLDVLSLSDNGGGSITGAPGGFDCAFLPNNTYGTGTCTGQRPTDSTVTLTATADSLSSFRGWWSPSACPPPSEGAPPQHLPCFFSSEPTITVILDENKVVAAQFQRKTLDLLSLADNGGGSITGSPGGFDCVFAPNIVYGTGLCTGQRPTDSAVTLTATPDSLSSFRGWYAPFACPPPSPGAPPNYLPCFLSSEQTITVTLDDDKIVAARFQRVTLTTLSYGDNGGGTVTASPGAIACTFAPAEINGTGQCHAEMPTDTVATVTASPGSAATFLGWYAVFACPVPPSPLPPPSAPCLFSTNATISLTMDVSKIIGARFGSRPVADAGDDVSAPEASTVALDGSGSVDPEGDSLEYDWQQVGGPAMLLDATDPVHPRFTTPNVGPTSIVLTFQLTVSDGHGDSLPDVVNITVTNVNHPPVANAGADTAVAENSPVTLDGALSFDPDSDLLTHHWHQTGGSVVALSDADNARPAFTAPLVGVTGETLTFVLTVSDGNATGTDEVHVLVENANHPPSANAGSDQIVQDGDVVQLAGTASDPDGDPLTLGWIQTSGQTVTLSASATLTPAFTAPSVAPGSSETLTFRLDVTDSSGATASDTSTVQVQHPGDPPVCSAARPSQQVLWPPNHQLVPIEILGITNRTLDPVTVVITAVTQDEPVGGLGDGDTSPDAVIQGNRVLLRAERAGGSNGRVYEIRFDAITALGASCSGVVQVGVPPNMKPGIGVVNDGQGFRSTQP